jgi:general secretion pathway protein A
LKYASNGVSAPSSISPTPMYEEYYGFVQPPFTLAPDPRFLYRSESHDDAITALLQAIRRREGFIVLAGDIGTGKTTICRALLQHLDASTFTSLVLNPFVSVEELLREVLLDFGVVSREAVRSGRLASATKHDLISTLNEFLLSLIAIRGTGVLIIDEAQHLSPEVLEQIRIISNLETNDAKLLQIVLVGQLNLLDVLAEAEMRQLEQRISVRALLKPLTRDETEAYVAHRLSVASGTTPVTFEPGAIDVVHTYSGGVPRIVNLICDRALMTGAEAGVSVITPDMVKTATGRLDLKLPRAGAALGRGRLLRRAVIAAAVVAVVAVVLLVAPLHRLVDTTTPPLPAPPTQRAPIAEPLTVIPPPDVRIPLPPNL